MDNYINNNYEMFAIRLFLIKNGTGIEYQLDDNMDDILENA